MKSLRESARRLCAAGLVLSCSAVAWAQPANDNCSSPSLPAIPGGGGTINGDATGATRDGAACAGANGGDIWYTFTPAVTGRFTFSLCSTATAWDSVLSLHPSCPSSATDNNSIAGACNDDFCGFFGNSQFTTTTSLTAGTLYYLRVAEFDVADGAPFTLVVTPLVPITNDECNSANPLITVGTAITGSNQTASTSFTITPNTVCGPAALAGGGADLFYRFIPPATGTYSLSLCGSTFDTVLSVHSACPADSSNVLACNDDSTATVPCAGTFSLQSFIPNLPLTGGLTYTVRVAGYNNAVGNFTLLVTSGGPTTGSCCAALGTCTTTAASNCTGTFTANAACTPNPCPQPQTPANDVCSTTTAPVLVLNVPSVGSNIFSTTDGASSCPTAGTGSDVYFRFTPAASDTYTFTTCSATVGLDSVLSIHSGCPADTTNELGCDDDSTCTSSGLLSEVIVQLTAGQQYIVRVAGYAGAIATGDQDAFQVTVVQGGVGPTTGACCTATNVCTVVPSAGCAGTYQGDGSTCTPNPCNAPTGACCVTAGTCSIRTSAGCAGTYQGDGSVCTPNPCPQPTGACCAASGACTIQTAAACATSGGTFRGLGTDCNPNLCPVASLGRCCFGATCRTGVTAASCTGINTQFTFGASGCNVGVNYSTPCCFADFNKSGQIGAQDIFDFLTAWFGNLPSANITNNGNGAPGVQSIFDFLTAWFAGGC